MHKIWIAIVAAVALGGAYVTYWWTAGRFHEETDDAYVGADITVIAPKVSGRVATVAVTDNQEVHAGDLLVAIDDRDARAALARAEAEVAAQQAALEHLGATQTLQHARIAQANADLASAKAELVRSRYDFQRGEKLLAERVTSTRDFEQADADYQKASAGEQHGAASVDAAQRELRVIDSQRKQITAALAHAIAERDLAQIALDDTRIVAPVDGVVGNRTVRVGNYVSPGTSLMSVVPSAGLWVDANFKENQLAHMHVGQRVTVVADVDPDTTIVGRVVSLAPATGAQFSVLPIENATGNFTKIVQRVPVRIVLEGEAAQLGVLRPGLSVTADVDLHEVRPTVAVMP